MTDLSICIVSYNTRAFLRDCLDSINRQQQGGYEVIVVDNASTDGTLEMLSTEYTQVKIILNNGNQGYTASMNQALRAGMGRYLMQLNPDTMIQPGGFTSLLQYMDSHPDVGICTPRILNADGSLQRQCRRSAARPWDVITYFSGMARLFPNSRLFGRYLLTWIPDDQPFEVEAVSGSCMLVRREALESVGYLDEGFFAYQEDADFCFRAREKGWKVMYLPLADVVHYGGLGGSRHQPFRAIYEWHRSYYLYYRKHLSRDYFFLINWGMYLAMGLKLVLNLTVNLFRRERIVGTAKPGEIPRPV